VVVRAWQADTPGAAGGILDNMQFERLLLLRRDES
jgi:hypothetical protein